MSPAPRNRRLALGAAALAGVSAATFVVAQSTASSAASPVDFSVRFKAGTFHYVDAPPMQGPDSFDPSAGDTFVLTNRLFRGGARVGTLHATCVVTHATSDPTKTPILCSGAYRLKGGSILGSAVLSTSGTRNVIALSGGTGRYSGASGTAVEVYDSPDSGNGVIRFHLE